MSELLQQILTDTSARNATSAKQIAASSSKDFTPWGSSVEDL